MTDDDPLRQQTREAIARADTVLGQARRTTDKITCPYCGHLGSRVINSRPNQRHDGVWRRRQCAGCAKRYTTAESLIGKYPAA